MSAECNREFVTMPVYMQLPVVLFTALLTWIMANIDFNPKEETVDQGDIACKTRGAGPRTKVMAGRVIQRCIAACT